MFVLFSLMYVCLANKKINIPCFVVGVCNTAVKFLV
jgi:hypothetical protein